MEMPSGFIEDMRNLRFTVKLYRIIDRLFKEDYDVNITKFVASPITAPLSRTIDLDIHVHKATIGGCLDKHFKCLVSAEYASHPIEIKEKYDELADLIYNTFFKAIDDAKPRIFMISKEEALFIKNLKEELNSRGDFVVDVPKFVDALFKLGVMIPKEDIETPELNEKIEEEEGDELAI